MATIYHRLESDTQTANDAHLQEASGEIWGRPARQSYIPKVKAYVGPLPAGCRGIEFETPAPPDPGAPPGQAFWGPRNPGVTVEGDVVKIAVTLKRVNQ